MLGTVAKYAGVVAVLVALVVSARQTFAQVPPGGAGPQPPATVIPSVAAQIIFGTPRPVLPTPAPPRVVETPVVPRVQATPTVVRTPTPTVVVTPTVVATPTPVRTPVPTVVVTPVVTPVVRVTPVPVLPRVGSAGTPDTPTPGIALAVLGLVALVSGATTARLQQRHRPRN